MTFAAALVLVGQVMFAGLPVPGATVTAIRGDRRIVVTTDERGVYRVGELDEGAWTLRVEMLGFAAATRDIMVTADIQPLLWELMLLSFADIAKGATAAPDAGAPFHRAEVSPAAPAPPVSRAPDTPLAAPDDAAPADAGESSIGAAEGLLINGSVNNGATSVFAQPAAFGNNRRRPGSVYNGGIGILGGHSSWDARPYSFSSVRAPKPAYQDIHMLGTFGGPLRIPGIVQNRPNVFVGYQRTADTNATTQSALVPTAAQRSGDFSGRTIVDPLTGLPFAGGVIPRDRIAPQAAALLAYYPMPNADLPGGFNFQRPLLSAVTQHSVQSRITQPLNPRNQLFGTLSYQRTDTDTTSLFGFADAAFASALDTGATWTRRFSQFVTMRLRYQLTRQVTDASPYFAYRANVSGDAGIAGNNQEPVNWGPPALVFSSGLAGLTDALPGSTHSVTNGWFGEVLSSRGRHFITSGAGIRTHRVDILSQQDPRGAFTFTGSATGSDLADFLLGLPRTSSIAFGNADKFLRGTSYEAYINDDWRLSPGLTVNAGVRWEYEAPLAERFGRLVNLDIAPGFVAASPVIGSTLRPDRHGVQPRVGIAWRPIAGSSIVVRAGYGIYRNASVYQPLVTLLAQQPPLSQTFSVETGPAAPLTLATGLTARPGTAFNTFAIDPALRVAYAQNWQASLQRDLPASLTIVAAYLGTRGHHLFQQFLPNTYPSGAPDPCPTCPAGFVYLTSNGRSSRHAGQFQIRRRLRNGFTASALYTLARALDDAATFAGGNLNTAVVAQDWLDLDAEYAPSSFDQRHLLAAQVQYTTGVGVRGGGLTTGLKGALIKNWTFTAQLTAGSGFPLTPTHLVPVRGTGVTGSVRANLIGGSKAPDGYYLDPASYAPPAPGRWGNAGRNSVTGPAQFALNAGIGRTFPRGDRLNLDWRLDATNVLNRVTFASVNMLVGSPQFGLPNRANPMRKLQTSLRVRF
jgi:hypothetical protein